MSSRTRSAGFLRMRIKFDWVGQWASVGLFDESVLASALLLAAPEDVPQKPAPDASSEMSERNTIGLLATFPAYAQIAVKGTAQAAVALAAIRVVANETIPGMFEWGEVERYRDVPIVRIHMKKELGGFGGEGSGLSLFYAVTSDAITLTFQDWVLRRLIDEALDGRGAAPSTDAGSRKLLSASPAILERGSGRPWPGWWSRAPCARRSDLETAPSQSFAELPRSRATSMRSARLRSHISERIP